MNRLRVDDDPLPVFLGAGDLPERIHRFIDRGDVQQG